MPTPDDQLAVDLPDPVRDLVARVDPRRDAPVVKVRRRTCGCWLASVYRVGDRLLLLAGRRALVQVREDQAQARRQSFAVDLDNPDRPVDLGCEHAARGELVDLDALRRAARTATLLGTRYLI